MKGGVEAGAAPPYGATGGEQRGARISLMAPRYRGLKPTGGLDVKRIISR